jgi:hypothetical protein
MSRVQFTKYHEIDELVDTCSETLTFLFMDGLLTRIKKQAVKWRKKILMNHSRFWISSAKKKNKYHPSCQCRKTKVASCQVHATATGRTSGGPMGRGPAGPPGRNETRAAKFGTHSYRVWTPAQEEFPALRVDPFFPILENYLTIQELSQSYHPIYESMYSICWNHNGPQQSETGCNHSCKQTTSQLFLVVWFVFVLQ